MAALAHQRAAARVTPDAVHGRVRAAVRLAPQHPEDLRIRLLHDLAFLLHGGRVDPVLRVGEHDAAAPRRLHHAVGAGEGVAQECGLACLSAVRSEGARERLLDEHVLARLDGLESHRLVGGGRRAHVDHVDVRYHRGEIGVGSGPGFARECFPPLRGGRGHGGEAGFDAVHAAIGEQMQVGGEPRADDADPQRGHVVTLRRCSAAWRSEARRAGARERGLHSSSFGSIVELLDASLFQESPDHE